MHECSQQQFRTGENFHSNTSVDNRELHRLEFHQNRIAPPCSPLKQYHIMWARSSVKSCKQWLPVTFLTPFPEASQWPLQGSMSTCWPGLTLSTSDKQPADGQAAVIFETYGKQGASTQGGCGWVFFVSVYHCSWAQWDAAVSFWLLPMNCFMFPLLSLSRREFVRISSHFPHCSGCRGNATLRIQGQMLKCISISTGSTPRQTSQRKREKNVIIHTSKIHTSNYHKQKTMWDNDSSFLSFHHLCFKMFHTNTSEALN